MGIKIRMRQQGRKNRQTFRLVVADTRSPRDGSYIEMLGAYDPHRREGNITVNQERLKYWLGQGAELSDTTKSLIKGVSLDTIREFEAHQHQARRKRTVQRRLRNKEQHNTG